RCSGRSPLRPAQRRTWRWRTPAAVRDTTARPGADGTSPSWRALRGQLRVDPALLGIDGVALALQRAVVAAAKLPVAIAQPLADLRLRQRPALVADPGARCRCQADVRRQRREA